MSRNDSAGRPGNGRARPSQQKRNRQGEIERCHQGVEHLQALSVANPEEIAGRGHPEPSRDGGDQPVERRRKQPHPLVPDPAQPDPRRCAGNLHCHLAMRAGAQPVHGQQALAELPPTQEEIIVALDLARRPEADRHDRGEVAGDHHRDRSASVRRASSWRGRLDGHAEGICRGHDLPQVVWSISIPSRSLRRTRPRLGLARHQDLAVARHGP